MLLVWNGWFDRIDEAFWFEKQIQGWSRRKREALIRGDWDALPFLAKRPSAQRRISDEASPDAPDAPDAPDG